MSIFVPTWFSVVIVVVGTSEFEMLPDLEEAENYEYM